MSKIILRSTDLSVLPHGGTLVVTTFTGWDGTPEPKVESEELLVADGDVDGVENYHARYIELGGNVHAPDHDSLHRIGLFLNTLIPPGGSLLKVEGHGPTAEAWVRKSSSIRFDTITDKLAIFSVTLKANDPRKYGPTRRWPNTGTTPARTATNVSHEGNYPAAPVMYVTGYMPGGFTAFGTGSDRIVVTEGVNTGETLKVDFGTGHVYLNGVRKPAAGSYRDLATIPPSGRNTNVIPATEAGYGQYYVEVKDTWI